MTSQTSIREQLARVRATGSGAARDLAVGAWRIRFEGLGETLAGVLDARWGDFVTAPAGEPPTARVSVREAEALAGLPTASPGEGYRLEATLEGGPILVTSYAFAMAERRAGEWVLALAPAAGEPPGRTMDNVARWLVARLATAGGGLALHGAGILNGGVAWVFAGPSRAGKSTASRLASPAPSLGDDFAVVVPSGTGWRVPAVPFDNSEKAPRLIAGLHPLGGILRLFQAQDVRLDRPVSALAVASLMACVAFPWALPDRLDSMQEVAQRLVTEELFNHLHLTLDPQFMHLLGEPR